MQLIKFFLSVLIFFISISLGAGELMAQAPQAERLGGMNLWDYCNDRNEGGSALAGDTWICESGSVIDLNAACQWQYPNRNATARQEATGNPYRWACYNGEAVAPTPSTSSGPTATPMPANSGTRLGGMNLYEYCQSRGEGGSELSNNTWTCATGLVIDLGAACVGQYGQSATARQEVLGNPYTWACFAGGNTGILTPTPSTSSVPTATQTPTPAQLPLENTLVIFDDALMSGWADASYRATNEIITTPVATGARAIASEMDENGGFDLQSMNGLMTTNDMVLRFRLRTSEPNQSYEVYVDTTYGQPLNMPVLLDEYGGQPTPDDWRTYTIPLADLNATNTLIRNIVIHNPRNAVQPILYIDQVELRSSENLPAATPTPTNTIATPTPTRGGSAPIVRKNIYDLTPAELQRLTNAINTIRANGVYQDFMNRHMQAMMTLTQPNDQTTLRNVAHRGPSFLPWHRAFVWEFEQALRTADPTISLPYWAFEEEQAGQLPRVFSNEYFGSDGNPALDDRVIDGPFTTWDIIRRVGRDPQGQPTLPTQADVAALMQYENYDSPPYSETSNGFRTALEGWIGPNGQWSTHNRMHAYVGGDMLPGNDMTRNVVNDPIFWVAHANLDRIWWQWQQTRGINNYQPAGGGPTGHNLNDVMQFLPEGFTPAETLNIQDMGYSYQ